MYDVYHLVKPKVPLINIGNNLRIAKKFGEVLRLDTYFLFPPVTKDPNIRNKSTPALLSRESLDNFLENLRAGLRGPDLSEFTINTDKFRTDHAELLDQLWPPLDQPTPSSAVLGFPDNRRPTDASHEIPLDHAIHNIKNTLQPPLSIERTEIPGIYTTTCRIEDLTKLVLAVGVYTHTHWVKKTHTSKASKARPAKIRVRYKCFRASNKKKTSHKARTCTPPARTKQQQQQQPLSASKPSATDPPASTQQQPLSTSAPSATDPPASIQQQPRSASAARSATDPHARTPPATNGKNNKVERNSGRTLKCDCPAYIAGSYAPSDKEVTLTLDLRHFGHSPETERDTHFLPLLPEIRQKLDALTGVIREYSLVRRQLKSWIGSTFLPQEYPHFDVEHIKLQPLDGRFRPSDDEIKMSIRRANQMLRLSPVDQESTFKYLNEQKDVTYAFRPSRGGPLAYTCSPDDGLRASRVDVHWSVHHTSPALCEASSPDKLERAMHLYDMHNIRAAPPVKDEGPKSATGTIRYNSLHAHKIK